MERSVKTSCETKALTLCSLLLCIEQADLTLVTSLLSCKWWVSLWVGQLPVDVLRQVWDVMLGDEDGSILHLLLGLQFFQAAIDSVVIHMVR